MMRPQRSKRLFGISMAGCLLLAGLTGCPAQRSAPLRPQSQFPSPMADRTRAHERLENQTLPGLSFMLPDILPRPVEIYFAGDKPDLREAALLIHFHGSAFVAKTAVFQAEQALILAVVNLGAGSSVYERPFADPAMLPRLLKTVQDTLSAKRAGEIAVSQIYLSSFSAGYGAVRAILKHHPLLPDGILLLDGLHTDYVPEGQLLAEGGMLNEDKMAGFLQYAHLASAGGKKMLVTHSEIFPGTYASTSETADYLINGLGLHRIGVLLWGPAGMQQLSETGVEGFTVLGFAGNSAPDHIDHFHGLPVFLRRLLGVVPDD